MSDGPVNPEVLLISSVVTTGELGPPANEGIDGEHFHTHREEWEWIEDFVSSYRKAPDRSTFRSRFPEFPFSKSVDVEYATDAVIKSHLRYSLTSVIKPVAERLSDDDPVGALDLLRESLMGIDRSGSRIQGGDVLRDFDPILEEARRRVDAASSMGYSGVPFGFPTLDERTGGMHPGDLIVWAARLGSGKTWMLCRVAAEALLQGKRVCFVSLEQSRAAITFRIHVMLARHFGYDLRHRDLMQGVNYDIDDYRSFLVDLPKQVAGELVIADPTRGRASAFTLASMMENEGPDVMLVDYLTLMSHDGEDWRGARKLSADVKMVANQYAVPILAAAQINRMGVGGKRPPGVDKLAESDGIGQDADVVVTQRKMSESVIQGLIAKNRSGQDQQVFHAKFKPNTGQIEEISHEEAQTLMSTDALE